MEPFRDEEKRSLRSPKHALDDLGIAICEDEDARIARRLEPLTPIVDELRVFDAERARAIVADKEDGPASFARVIRFDTNARERERKIVPVEIERAAASSAWRPLPRGVCPVTDGAVAKKFTPRDDEGDADAADCAAVRAAVSGIAFGTKPASRDIDRTPFVLAEHSKSATAQIRPELFAAIALED